jgi:superfamily II DNA or RNA helicase
MSEVIAAAPKTVEVRRVGNLLQFDGVDYLHVLQPRLTYWHKTSYQGAELFEREKQLKAWRAEADPRALKFNPKLDISPRRMFRLDGRIVSCGAGLYDRVFKGLRECGVQPVWKDLRPPLPAPDYSRLSQIPGLQFRYKQMEALAAVQDYPAMIIEAPTGYGKSFLFELLVRVYHQSRILFIAPGRSLLASIYERLQGATSDLGRVGDGHLDPDRRVVVCSADSVHRVHLCKFHLIVHDEVHEAGTDRRIRSLASQYTDAKFVGVSASVNCRFDGADDLIESLFGPVVLQIPYDEAQAHGAVPQIHYKMVDVPVDPEYTPADDRVMANWKRRAYWRYGRRNQAIARAVAACPQWLNKPDPQILIMCENLDHAYQLKQLLPDFEVVYATADEERIADLKAAGLVPPDHEAMSRKQRTEHRKAFEAGTLRRVISTYTWKQGVNFTRLDAFLRADGSDSEIAHIQHPGRLGRLSDECPIKLLVDFTDRYDPKAAERSRRRLQHYRKCGWQSLS